MEWYFILLIVVAAVVVLFYIGFPILAFKVAFGRRYNKNPKLKYFSADEFNVDTKEVKTKLYGKTLRGFLYAVKPVEECEKLIIFQHGLSAGQSVYTTEIAALAKAGFAVLAFDAYGCDMSEGASVKGLYAGVDCVVAAFNFAKQQNELKNKPVCLVGHSWGAYSVLCATERVSVEKVVAISAPNNLTKVVSDMIKLGILRPVWWLCNLFACGVKGNTKAATALKNSGTKALLIHGKLDKIVALCNSAAIHAKGKNATVLIKDEKAHNPYNTVAAERLLSELNVATIKNTDDEYFKNFDFVAATEEDEAIMQTVIDFIKNSN